jgi:hypothetical protein
VYRSTDPSAVVAPANLLGTTSGAKWIDLPPPGPAFFYSVESDCVPNPPELCDGIDNDCNPGTPDGDADPAVGTPCDGSDGDLCVEGVRTCAGGGLLCDDATGSTQDLCNGLDDDCDPASADGTEDPGVGAACDGTDGDFCIEGTLACTGGSLACSDATGTSSEQCDGTGADEDCDGSVDEGFVRNDNPLCSAGTVNLGTVRGDAGNDKASTTDYYNEEWLRVRISESNSSTVNLTARIELYSPPGTDFDLFVYCAACGPTPIASSTIGSLSGHTDAVTIGAQDAFLGGDDSFDAIIEVRYFNATRCAPWSLKVDGNVGGTAVWCP